MLWSISGCQKFSLKKILFWQIFLFEDTETGCKEGENKIKITYLPTKEQLNKYRRFNILTTLLLGLVFPLLTRDKNLILLGWFALVLLAAGKYRLFYAPQDAYILQVEAEKVTGSWESLPIQFLKNKLEVDFADLKEVSYYELPAGRGFAAYDLCVLAFSMNKSKDCSFKVRDGRQQLQEALAEIEKAFLNYNRRRLRSRQAEIARLTGEDKQFTRWLRQFDLLSEAYLSAQKRQLYLTAYQMALFNSALLNARHAVYQLAGEKPAKVKAADKAFPSLQIIVPLEEGQAKVGFSLLFDSARQLYKVTFQNPAREEQSFYLPARSFWAWLHANSQEAEQLAKSFWQAKKILKKDLRISELEIACASLYLQNLSRYFWYRAGEAMALTDSELAQIYLDGPPVEQVKLAAK